MKKILLLLVMATSTIFAQEVKSIPATFLLDASGKIVAKDLRGEELKAKVKELLGVQ